MQFVPVCVHSEHEESQFVQAFPDPPYCPEGQAARQVLLERYSCSPEPRESPQVRQCVAEELQVRQFELQGAQV